MPNVLIVEDDDGIATLLEASFRQEGYAVRVSADGHDAETRLAATRPDLVVLDWLLPGVSGVDLCARIRKRMNGHRFPILMLSAWDSEAARLEALAAGADDYLGKPFSVQELLARCNSLLRREALTRYPPVASFGDITLNRETFRVMRRGREVHLGPTEFRILDMMLRTPMRVFTRRQILDKAWVSGEDRDERIVDVNIGRLRKALNSVGGKDAIRTIRGTGYGLASG
ncbi:MAG: DNA-binding response regulator [Kaistia sp. SCN 65-12]|nr:MAG: DNA-binding response regulator [Kaistia sp. SCN 65-12]